MKYYTKIATRICSDCLYYNEIILILMALLLWVHYSKVVNKTFVSMMEALGYDVRLVYEEREASK